MPGNSDCSAGSLVSSSSRLTASRVTGSSVTGSKLTASKGTASRVTASKVTGSRPSCCGSTRVVAPQPGREQCTVNPPPWAAPHVAPGSKPRFLGRAPRPWAAAAASARPARRLCGRQLLCRQEARSGLLLACVDGRCGRGAAGKLAGSAGGDIWRLLVLGTAMSANTRHQTVMSMVIKLSR